MGRGRRANIVGRFDGDAGRHHGHPDDAVEALVEGRADDDVGVRVDLFADAGGGFVDLVKGEILAAGDRDQDSPGATHRNVIDERVGDSRLGGKQRPPVAGSFSGAHHRAAHFSHDGADVGKIQVDEAFLHNQVGDAGDAGMEHLVGHRKGVGQRGLLVGHPEQVLVRDDDQRVDALLQLHDAGLGEPHSPLALEVERLGDDADREDAELAGHTSHHRRRAGSGAAAHARGNEHHVSAGQVVADLVDHFLGCGAADLRLRACAETSGRRHAHLDDVFGPRHGQCLGIRVGDDEIDALEAGIDHVVDGVTAGTADAEDGNPRLQFADVQSLQVGAQRHTSLVRGGSTAGVSPVGAAARRRQGR